MRLRRILPPLLVLAVGGALIAFQAREEGPTAPGPAASGTPAAGTGGSGPGDAPEEKPARIQPVQVRTVPRTESFRAVVRAPEPTPIPCPLPHTPVEEVLVRVGQAVKTDELVVRMSGASWEKALDRAREAKDAAAIARAEDALRSLEVRSPVDGVVFQVDASRGEIPIVPRDGRPRPLVLLFDWRKMAFEGAAPPEVAKLLREGAPVFVRVGAEGLVPVGEVRFGEPGADGSLPVTALLEKPPAAAPASGEAAEIHVVAGTSEVLVIPRAAVRFEGGRAIVWVHQITEELRAKPVVLGAVLPDEWVEVSGLGRLDSVAVWSSEPKRK